MSHEYVLNCHFSFVICHLSFLISHLSYKAKPFDESFKGGKICIINISKGFACGENFDKKYIFDSVLDRIRMSSRSATTLISQQP